MKKRTLLLFLSALLVLSACSKKENDDTGDQTDPNVVTVTSDITTNTTWKADKIYFMKGTIHVLSGATLTIEPGTLIKGDKATKACLVISRGGKINADGTADNPIVFTSNQAIGARAAGDWGGVILLGRAPSNNGTDVQIEGISVDDNGKYGGTVADDNSGVMRYVRIEYAGVPLSPDNEINGLTFGGVGSGTVIDYIEVYRSGDDGFEWFGGTVNCKHLLSIGSLDDDFDTDNGFSGKVQFALAQRYLTLADVSGSNGFESDNDASGSANTPQTSAVFSNVTIVGPMSSVSLSGVNANYQHAAQIRRSSALSTFNSVFVGYPEGIFYDDATIGAGASKTSENLSAGRSVFANNLVYGCNVKSNEVKASNATALAVVDPILRGANDLQSGVFATAVMNDPYKYSPDMIAASTNKQGTPDFTVKAGSAAASGALFTNAKLSDSFFDKTVAFRGAFGPTNWASGWTNWDPQSMPYDAPGKVK